MNTNMTERDKKLLVFMFMIVIIVGIGYWGVIPQIKAANSYSSKAEDEEDEKKINRMKIVNASSIEMQADDYKKQIAEKKDEFYQLMTNSEVDRMMTEMATSEGLEIYDLTFVMPQKPSNRMAYINSPLYKEQKAAKREYEEAKKDEDEDVAMTAVSTGSTELSEETSKTDKKKKETIKDVNEQLLGVDSGYQPNTDIFAVPVTMTVGGNLSDLNAFLNKIINSDKRILLVSYSWGQYRSVLKYDEDGNYIGNESSDESLTESVDSESNSVDETEMFKDAKKSLKVTIEIYMCDTSNVASEGDADTTD